MTVILLLLALICHIAGFIFVFAAALGLLRFKDPLQRMHAATKAGTLGAGLNVAGTAIASGDGLTLVVGTLTILFLFFTVPTAGHLLGRAIYVSGVPLSSLESRDALKNVLHRRASDNPEEALGD